MNSRLIKYSLCLLALNLVFASCKKSENIEKKGIINVDVLYTCAGCQGSAYDIKFITDTAVYHIANDLTQFGITNKNNFPVNVTVDSKPDNGTAGNFLIITALKMNN